MAKGGDSSRSFTPSRSLGAGERGTWGGGSDRPKPVDLMRSNPNLPLAEQRAQLMEDPDAEYERMMDELDRLAEHAPPAWWEVK